MTTRAYNISELGLMRLEDVLKYIAINGLHDPYEVGELCKNVRMGFTGIIIPIKYYAASVVERFAETLPLYDGILWEYVFYDDERKDLTVMDLSKSVFIFHCPINPFTGLLNPDGTQRTSATRKEIEQWKKEG